MPRKGILLTIRYSLLLALLFSTSAARAGDMVTLQSGETQTLLLELYTSQGCSSCPPAEKWLSRLVNDPRLWRDIIPVAFHVDYWDWIGWKDPYASEKHTRRQRAYRKIKHVESVYTPCFIANGREWRSWFSLRRKLPSGSVLAGKLSAQIRDHEVQARYSHAPGELVLNVALLGVGLSTKIASGENAGRELKHDFSVLGWTAQASTNVQWSLSLPTPTITGARRYAVALWISRPGSGVPLQAAGAWLPGYRPPIDS